jgi:hypothetical protein
MDFINYLKEMRDLDGTSQRDSLDVFAKPQVQDQTTGFTSTSFINGYLQNGEKLKVSLSRLGKDLGDEIYKYATEELVTEESFNSLDDYVSYKTLIRDNVKEKMNVSLVEILKNIGIFIDNKVNEKAN